MSLKLDDINDMWEKDSNIDEINLTHESLRTPNLNAKYLKLLTAAKMERRKAEIKYYEIKTLASRYYKGELDRETLNELGWKQYLGPKILKSEIDTLLTSDKNVIKEQNKYEYYNILVSQIESILKTIAGRSFDIRNAIEFSKFQNGIN